MAKRSTRLEALHSTFEENGISPDTIELNDSLIRDIKKHADAVPDYKAFLHMIQTGSYGRWFE